MNKVEIIKKAKLAAARNARNRKDPRYVRTMGFLVSKGFLITNQNIPRMPNARIDIEDAIWAGKNVEPRILEVLPAAVFRLNRHFNYDPDKHTELGRALHFLKVGGDGLFFDIPIEKIRRWLNIRLNDGRVVKTSEKKIMRSFRLSPRTIAKLEELKKTENKSGSEVIEQLVNGA